MADSPATEAFLPQIEYEYEADAHAASLGDDYRLGMRRALDDISEWEKPRSEWEDSLAVTHPPIELRLEWLESPLDALPNWAL